MAFDANSLVRPASMDGIVVELVRAKTMLRAILPMVRFFNTFALIIHLLGRCLCEPGYFGDRVSFRTP